MSSESALTHVDTYYRNGNIDLKIRQHLTAFPQECSDESSAGFIMATELIIFRQPFSAVSVCIDEIIGLNRSWYPRASLSSYWSRRNITASSPIHSSARLQLSPSLQLLLSIVRVATPAPSPPCDATQRLVPAELFGALKVLVLVPVPAPDVDLRPRGQLFDTLTDTRLELLELSLEGISDEISLQAVSASPLAVFKRCERMPVVSRSMDTTSSGIGITLRHIFFGHSLGTQAGKVDACELNSPIYSSVVKFIHAKPCRHKASIREFERRDMEAEGTYRSRCCTIMDRTLALLRLAPARLLDQLAAAPNRVVRVKHEQYGGWFVGYLEKCLLPHSGWDVHIRVSYSPSLRLDAVLMEGDGQQTYGASALLRYTANIEIERTWILVESRACAMLAAVSCATKIGSIVDDAVESLMVKWVNKRHVRKVGTSALQPRGI
ncbi:hypothetical protein EDB84DRAFT_1443396 [Lactarius hengduanensis]|nr:hypothetical protein EDB84DRAFT_1443396 [Lactarius hengduanensis]